jgi:hypothetical protein
MISNCYKNQKSVRKNIKFVKIRNSLKKASNIEEVCATTRALVCEH